MPKILATIFGMANWSREAMQRLGAAVKAQRLRRGLTQIQVWEAGGPANSTLTAIEAADQEAISTSTLRKLDIGLGWTPGTALSVLVGEAEPADLTQVETDELLAEIKRRIDGATSDRAQDWPWLNRGGGDPGAVRQAP